MPPRLTLDHNYTSNGRLMLDPGVIADITSGIDNPSDAIIPAETSLYRIAHSKRYNKKTGLYERNDDQAAYRSPWWSTDYHFNAAIWANPDDDMSRSGRQAFAIHPAWRSDCRNYASIVLRTDLSVWYGLGNPITLPDPDTNQPLTMQGSPDVLQIYIPGFWDNHAKWAKYERVIAFEKSLSNGRGFQGNLPRGLRSAGA